MIEIAVGFALPAIVGMVWAWCATYTDRLGRTTNPPDYINPMGVLWQMFFVVPVLWITTYASLGLLPKWSIFMTGQLTNHDVVQHLGPFAILLGWSMFIFFMAAGLTLTSKRMKRWADGIHRPNGSSIVG